MGKRYLIKTTLICGMIFLSGCSFSDKENDGAGQIDIDLPIWEKKTIPGKPLKVGIITDTQVHPSRYHKWQDGPDAQRYLKPRYGDAIDAFVEEMKIFQPDVIVVPGDIIEGTNDEDFVGIAGLQLVQEKIQTIGVPVIWVVGNHELRSVTKQQYMDALGIDYLNGSFEFDGHKIIIVDGNFHPDDSDVVPGGDRYIRGHVARSGIDYLEKELQTDKRTIVFIHQPPLVGEDIPERSPNGLLDNGAAVQEILAKYNVFAAIGGHIEYKRRVEKDNIQYYALPGAIKSEAYAGAYYTANFEGDSVHMTMYYIDPATQKYIAVDFDAIPDGSGKKSGGEYE